MQVSLGIDGTGRAEVSTGIGFLDHMLELFAHHGRFDLQVRATGDLDVDGHHTVEDIGLALGQALAQALGDKRGIRRYGSFLLPMDEALAMVVLDLSGRPYFVHDLQLAGVRIGDVRRRPHGALPALALDAGGYDAARAPARGRRRPPHRRGGVQGRGAGAGGGLRAPRPRRRGAVHQGDALTAVPRAERPVIAVVDYGMGNLASVAKALERSGAEARVTQSPAAVRDAGAVVLPGVGAFRDAAERLERSGLGAAVLERIAAGRPFLGVCLGLQLLLESSAEGGRWTGLGVFPGTVERIDTALKVPHIGWNDLEWTAAGAGMSAGLPAQAAVYFVHSYAARPADPALVAATTDYGGPVVAALARDNVWAVQFHPEKSSSVGLRLLANFVAQVTQEAAT